MNGAVTNVVIAGLGGQGVLKCSDILAEAVFRAGYDVKKAEIHGMSQRGGSVSSDVRFGARVHSPMVPEGEADFLLSLSEDQADPNRHCLKMSGLLITPRQLEGVQLPHPKSLNVALLGVLSAHLDADVDNWRGAVAHCLPEKLHAINLEAFEAGRAAVRRQTMI